MPREYDHGRDPAFEPSEQPDAVRTHRVDEFYATPPAATVFGQDDLEQLNKADLVELAEERGVDSSGTKAELIARLSGG